LHRGIRISEADVFFRIWLITSLIVAFVAASWAFGIRITPGPVVADRDLAIDLRVIDDGGR